MLESTNEKKNEWGLIGDQPEYQEFDYVCILYFSILTYMMSYRYIISKVDKLYQAQMRWSVDIFRMINVWNITETGMIREVYILYIFLTYLNIITHHYDF